MKRSLAIMIFLILILCLSGCKSKAISNTMDSSSYETAQLDGTYKSPSPDVNKKPMVQPTGYIVYISPEPTQNSGTSGTAFPPYSSLAFCYKRIRTNSYASYKGYPKAIVLHNTKELADYYKSALESFQMDSFKEAIAVYDDKWFENNILILVVIEESSGSVGHKVTSVFPHNKILEIDISRIIPEIGTCDMAQYHILIGISSSDYNGETPEVIFKNRI